MEETDSESTHFFECLIEKVSKEKIPNETAQPPQMKENETSTFMYIQNN